MVAWNAVRKAQRLGQEDLKGDEASHRMTESFSFKGFGFGLWVYHRPAAVKFSSCLWVRSLARLEESCGRWDDSWSATSSTPRHA